MCIVWKGGLFALSFLDHEGSRAPISTMRAFADAWQDNAFVERIVGQLPWGQNIELLGIKNPVIRLWYAEVTLRQRQGKPSLTSIAFYHRPRRTWGGSAR